MSQFRSFLLAGLFVVSLLLMVAMPAMAQESLYDRLGGQAAIETVVAESVGNWLADERINEFFINLSSDRQERLAGLLVEQICEATGGPCTYSGLDMTEAHIGLGLTDEHFDALVEGMGAAMATLNVPQAEQEELVALLAPMRDDMVESMEPPTTMPETGGAVDNAVTWATMALVLAALVFTGWWQKRQVRAN